MLARLSMTLKTENEKYFNVNKSSLLHGVIMESIDADYAEILHNEGLNPFTSTLINNGDEWVWVVCALNKTAYERIILKLMDSSFDRFEIVHNKTIIKITCKNLETKEKTDLIKEFYNSSSKNYISIRFITPTAFKTGGKYIFYPDLELFFKSLMNKYSQCTEDESFFDDDTLESIMKNTSIIKYNLKSVLFSLEGVKIPGFIGIAKIKMTGAETMKRFVRMLLKFGEYSGVGIKCSLGMGRIELTEKY